MKTLIINTCTNRIIIAIADNSTVFSSVNEIIENQMSNIIMSKIKYCFDKSNLKPQDIDRILVAVGPGSYTGIRIGVAIAKTMAWTLNKEILPISSLEMLISGYDDEKILVPMIDARRKAVFTGIYDSNLNNLMEDQYMSLETLKDKIKDKNSILVSDDDILNSKTPQFNFIKLINKYDKKESVNPHSLNPVYLKKTEAEENLKND